MKTKILIAIIVIAVIIIVGVLIYVATNQNEGIVTTIKDSRNQNNQEIREENKMNNEKKEYLSGKYKVEIEVKDLGVIALELDADIAPITVTNFVKLVKEGFYNGLTFHRIIDGFMIQGGDPLGTGMGGSSEKIKGEFIANGVANSISHVRGVISMARSMAYDSASSQFFIVHEDSTFLDGQYASFGKVTSGMEIVDEIAKNTKVEDNNGTVLKENQPVIKEIRIVE
ncbi:MAG: peptidylprolyl isomerase [Clostridia bacterium]|nr:peptidylprolyl isomerase [Clostridia bacterium]